jgi:CRISPR-associated endonuclease Cas1/CRISPR-associated protein Cas4
VQQQIVAAMNAVLESDTGVAPMKVEDTQAGSLCHIPAAQPDGGRSARLLPSSATVEDMPPMPVRRLQNYAYCARLFYYQWVEDLFVENADTVGGTATHRQTDKPSALPEDPKELELPEGARLRSLQLESETLGLVGKIDVVEGTSEGIEVIDHKKGAARRNDDGARVAKEYDAVQVAAYALLLREAGHNVTGASIYYATDRRRVPVALTEELFATVHRMLAEAKAVAVSGKCPPPLRNDARCLRCSAYPVCLPNESAFWKEPEVDEKAQGIKEAPRPPGDEGEVIVVQKPGCMVGQRGGEFVITEKGETLQKFPMNQVRAIYLYGAVQLTAQAAQVCLEEGIDVAYFSPAGRFLGMLRGLPSSGVDARLGQYRMFGEPGIRVKLAREMVRAKIHNQRVLLMRNGEPADGVLRQMAELRDAAEDVRELDSLRGIEGTAAALYFGQFATMLGEKVPFDFNGRNRRPPRDPVNALLSQGYSILAKELAGVLHTVGLDPFLGCYHQPRYGRPALALDMMEEFRPLVADSVALSLLNRGELTMADFSMSAAGCYMKESGRRVFWEA